MLFVASCHHPYNLHCRWLACGQRFHFVLVVFAILASSVHCAAKTLTPRLMRLERKQPRDSSSGVGKHGSSYRTVLSKLKMEKVSLQKEIAELLASEKALLADQIKELRAEPYSARLGSIKTCGLKLCQFGDHFSPRLFVAMHVDGAGNVIQNIINGMAAAKYLKMNFGGVIQPGLIHEGKPGMVAHAVQVYRIRSEDEHGHNMKRVVDGLWGVNSWNQLFRVGEVKFDEIIWGRGGLRVLSQNRYSFGSSANIYIPSVELPRESHLYFPDAFRAALRGHLDSRPLRFLPGKVSIAIHLRRGDVKESSRLFLSEDYVHQVLDDIRREESNLDIHLWSAKGMKSTIVWNSSHFDGFRKRGIHVHLDDMDDDLADLWAHMARAQIFIMSPSHFSYVPAVLNQNCVIRPKNMDSSQLGNWINGEEKNVTLYRTELANCISRARSQEVH